MMSLHRHTRPLALAGLLLPLVAWTAAPAAESDGAGNSLQAVDYAVLPGDQVEIRFDFAQPVSEPRTFTIRDPARIALDFADTSNATGQRNVPLDVGTAESLDIAEAGGRTRVVLNLVSVPQYSTQIDGSTVVMTLGASGGDGALQQASTRQTQSSQGGGTSPATNAGDGAAQQSSTRQADQPFQGEGRSNAADTDGARSLENVDFRRGEQGQGRIQLDLSNPDIPVNIEREGNQILVELSGTRVSSDQRQRLDVLDFATPVKFIDVRQRGDNVQVRITPRTSEYEQLAYQSGDKVTVELREPTEDPSEAGQEPEYTGERLSLNFQEIEVRAVLQLLADFTGLNLVVSDSVGGSITLRLKNVPWDQALDIVLRTQGLDKRRNGNVIFIAPRQELAAREQAQMEAQQKQAELAPLRTEYIQVNYAKASELASVLQSQDVSLLSERASVTVDQRTNTLLVRATADNLEQVRQLVERLDIPVRQVLIESRIVIATDDFNKELGVRFGVNRDTGNFNADMSGDDIAPGSRNEGATVGGSSQAVTNMRNDSDLGDDRFNVNMPVTGAAGTMGLALAKLPFGTLIELELSALQAEGRGEVVSSPRVITANQNEASIEQGVQIPYQEASSSGATSVSFQEAVLSLSVTPQITPDDRIVMDLEVTKDQVGQIFNGIPSIDTRQVATRVLVDNGETVVLGGIYEQTKNNQVTRVPFFGDLPVVGRLFQQRIQQNDKSELLVFVTPKIIKSAASGTSP